MKNITILFIAILPFLYSCEKDDHRIGLTDEMGRDSLYNLMHEVYYWYREMPDVEKDNYPDPYKLIDAMRYRPVDRFSFVADYEKYHAEMGGAFVGHGIRVGVDRDNKARIAMIFDKSPLYSQGVRRGWTILSVNGVDIGALLVTRNTQAYNTVFGPAQAGITNTFVFRKPDGTSITISSAKASFQTNTVLHYDTLHLASGIAGHLVYESFISPSEAELAKAFGFFKSNNVKDLVLDLRYNPGGLVDLSRKLASFIAGNNLAGTPLAKLEYNDKQTEKNHTYSFITSTYSLSLSRLVIITSRSTASASEFIINGLRPHMEVVTIGDTTYGKPVGYNGFNVAKKYVFAPTTFKIVNSLGQGEYYFGIPPSRAVADDVTHDFSDRRELCLREAIYYLENGAVSAKGAIWFRNNPQYSERPDWMSNMVLEMPL
jgi:carboxyl-terminal processing protease